MSIHEVLFSMLVAGAVGLLIGLGVARWRRRAVDELAPQGIDLLLVDDSAVARAKLRRLFEPAGYTVQLARDGVEALALLNAGHYQLMITDLEMPNMDGPTLIANCRNQARTERMPILAVTGHENLRAQFNQCRNISGLHRKPWHDDILLSHVAALVGPRQARAPALGTDRPAAAATEDERRAPMVAA
jgi:CheY-like chemotaxis protein